VCYPGGCSPLEIVLPGPCPVADNCVQFTITGSFTVVGRLTGLPPGAAVSVIIPVVDASGRSLGTRTVSCGVASAAGIATCNAVVNEPGVFPAVGATAPPLATIPAPSAGATSTGPGSGPSVRPLLPPLPPLPPLLPPPPPPPPLVPMPPPPVFGPAAAAEPAGVPVIPEATTGGLLLAGLLVLAGVSRWRRR
jgi:hypothetical protein